MADTNLKYFCNLYLLKNLIKKLHVLKNPKIPELLIS